MLSKYSRSLQSYVTHKKNTSSKKGAIVNKDTEGEELVRKQQRKLIFKLKQGFICLQYE